MRETTRKSQQKDKKKKKTKEKRNGVRQLGEKTILNPVQYPSGRNTNPSERCIRTWDAT
jgi:hypothetical protein